MERKDEVAKNLIDMIDKLSMDNKNLQDRISVSLFSLLF